LRPARLGVTARRRNVLEERKVSASAPEERTAPLSRNSTSAFHVNTPSLSVCFTRLEEVQRSADGEIRECAHYVPGAFTGKRDMHPLLVVLMITNYFSSYGAN